MDVMIAKVKMASKVTMVTMATKVKITTFVTRATVVSNSNNYDNHVIMSLWRIIHPPHKFEHVTLVLVSARK
jgi:hypothetical protein